MSLSKQVAKPLHSWKAKSLWRGCSNMMKLDA